MDQTHIKVTGTFETRHIDLRLYVVASVETASQVHPSARICAISHNGIELNLLFLFMILRHSCLSVQCGTFGVTIEFSGDDIDYRSIGNDILNATQAGSCSDSRNVGRLII